MDKKSQFGGKYTFAFYLKLFTIFYLKGLVFNVQSMPSWPYISLEEVKGTKDEFKFKAGMFEGIWTNLMVSCTLYSLQKCPQNGLLIIM